MLTPWGKFRYHVVLPIIEVEAAVSSDQCDVTCPDDSKCGGARGLVSVYDTFKAFSTLELTIKITNLNNESVEAVKDDGNKAEVSSEAVRPISTNEV